LNFKTPKNPVGKRGGLEVGFYNPLRPVILSPHPFYSYLILLSLFGKLSMGGNTSTFGIDYLGFQPLYP
jgi:hypothetical protein